MQREISRTRFRMSEDRQALVGALILIALLPFLFGMIPVKGLLTAVIPVAWWPMLGLTLEDVESLRIAVANWKPFLEFGTWRFLALGLAMTVAVSLISILLSLPLATLAALARLSSRSYVRWPTIAGIEMVRAFPVLILIFYVFTQFSRAAEASGSSLLKSNNVTISVIIALTLYTTVVNAETIRAGILSLDRGQTEAARSLGLSYAQALRLVILPQTFRRVLPPLIAQFVTLVKDTSLGAIIGLLELYRRGQILYQYHRNPLETLWVIAVIYFLVNYALGQVAQRVERRFTGSRRGVARDGAPHATHGVRSPM
jgi:His/Glu/Gln/Arg/opine family amino acid ABC transporter permease subunit